MNPRYFKIYPHRKCRHLKYVVRAYRTSRGSKEEMIIHIPHILLNNPFVNKNNNFPNFLQSILHTHPHNLFNTIWIRPPCNLEHLWNCPTMYSFLFSGPRRRTLEVIVTWIISSSQYGCFVARRRFLKDWSCEQPIETKDYHHPWVPERGFLPSAIEMLLAYDTSTTMTIYNSYTN